MRRLFLSFLALFSLLLTSPQSSRTLEFRDEALTRAVPAAGLQPLAPLMLADLQADGSLEGLTLHDGQAAITSAGNTLWESPPEWQVIQAGFADLDRSGLPEAVLLVWRSFEPWPVDRFLPYGGRIAAFHDREGESCHIILVGWLSDGYQELWAGSAMADPVRSYAAVDLDRDTLQELVTLEGRYDDPRNAPGRAVKVWVWNGFGFSLVSELEGVYSTLVTSLAGDGRVLILLP
jgi:hypothetical protein